MTARKIGMMLVVACLFLSGAAPIASAGDTLYFVLMASKDPVREARKFKALSHYISRKTPDIGAIKLKVARDYSHAVVKNLVWDEKNIPPLRLSAAISP